MFEDALRYPWTGDRNVETLAIGGLLSLLGVFIVPALFVYGYLVRVVRETSAGRTDAPPEFDDWVTLLVDGIVTVLIALVYTVVPAVIVALVAAAWLVPFSVTSSSAVGAGQPGGMPPAGGADIVLAALAVFTGLLALLLFVVALYLFPAAIGAYARTGSVGAAFSPTVLRRLAGGSQYLVAVLVALAVTILAQVVAGLAAATVIGLLLVPFLTFYGNVAAAYAVGRGVSEVPLPEQYRDRTAVDHTAG